MKKRLIAAPPPSPPWRRLDRYDKSGRRLFVAGVEQLAEAVKVVPSAGGSDAGNSVGIRFKLLLVTSIAMQDGPAAVELADRMIEAGCCYACCIGTDCSRWHDCFDEAIASRRSDAPNSLKDADDLDHVIHTTWHERSEEDGVRFFLAHANPREGFRHACDRCLILVIGLPAAAQGMERLLKSRKMRTR